MINDDEWDLIMDLTEVLSVFAEATEVLGGNNYITNSLYIPMLMEITKTLTTNLLSYDKDSDSNEQDDVFENDDKEEELTNRNIIINEPVNTFGLLDKVKSKLFTNIKKYYPTLTTENLIPSILDPQLKKLDFALIDQQVNTERHLYELFEQEKEDYQKETGIPNSLEVSQPKSLAKKKTLMARLTKDNVVALNEVGEYLQLPEIPLDSNPLAWWNEKNDKFPILSHLARKYLAVSATSTASERLFSDAGNLLTNKRTRMKPELFKKIMFLKRNASNFDTIHPNTTN